MSHCPSCGHFIGPRDTCPHCGAHNSDRMTLRAIKIAAVSVTAVGLLLLWLLAARAEPPTVPIGQVGATMNLAYVRLMGRVSGGPGYDPDSHYLTFWLSDDSGEIYVAAYRNEAEELLAQANVPALGDHVSVAGTLRVREDFTSLTINAADQLDVTTPEPSERAIAEIDPYSELERVRLRGQIRDIRQPYEGLILIGLRDGTGLIEIAVPEETLALTGPLPPLRPGQAVIVEGTVTFYKDTPQLTLTDVTDLTPLAETAEIAPLYLVSAISSQDMGRWVGVKGFLTEIAHFSAGVKLTLDDGSGEITVLLWQDLYDELQGNIALEEGAALTVYGQLSEYRDELEIIPELPVDVQAAAALPSPQILAIGDLSADDVGSRVELDGTLGEPDPFSAGVKFALDDGTGRITLLLWQDVYDDLAAGQTLQAGTKVSVVGELGEYRGELEIIPRRAADVTVTGYTPPPAQEPLPIGRIIAGDFIDQIVTLTGTLGEPQPFSAGVKFTLDDGSGEITLLLWQDVYDALGDELSAGAQVQVTGKIAQYKGDLEIIPRAAADVIVLAPSAPMPSPTAPPTLAPTVRATRPVAPTSTPTPAPRPTATLIPIIPTIPIGEIDAGRAGETLVLRGQVLDTASFAGGFKFTLDDGTGQIVLVLWGDIYDAVADLAGLNTGASVLISGEIGQYEGELQITPGAAGDVSLETAGAGPDAPRRETGSLNAADLGAMIEIEGSVSRVEEFSSGLRVYVDDGSGEVQLLLWQNVAERLPEREKLLAGARVRAVGELGEYKGILQIVPRLPFDIEVLD